MSCGLARSRAFPGSTGRLFLFVNSVPKQREAIAHRSANSRCHGDEDETPANLKGFDHIDWFEKMYPEDEVDHDLRPAK